MAVTFKVPKSPSRDIAITDSFMGVDLTNTGANIDGYRSPHAPNMVRLVPGKVRKRMGYYKEILFGTDENVNFADGTSAQEKEIHISSLDIGEWVKVYDLIQEVSKPTSGLIPRFSLNIEFDCKSTNEFSIGVTGDNGFPAFPQHVDPSEDWVHISGTVQSFNPVNKISIQAFDAGDIYIKNLALLKTKTASYEWSPAPKYFVERETNDPIYGCHFLKNGTDGFDGDRVVNVNRALNTSNEYEGHTVISNTKIFDLAEVPCPGQTVYVDFDYNFSPPGSGTYDYACVWIGQLNAEIRIEPGEDQHISTSFKLSDFGDNNQFRPEIGVTIVGADYPAIFGFKNFSVCYEKDENFKWSPAPEDSKAKFHLHDMYVIEPKDYAATNSFTKETTSFNGSKTETFVFSTDDLHGGEFQYISFDITTSLTSESATLNNLFVGVQAEWGTSSSVQSVLYVADGSENLRKKHVEFFSQMLPQWEGDTNEHYLKQIIVQFNASGSTKAKISISNLTVKNFKIRDSYTVSSKWFLYHVGKEFYLRSHDTGKFTSVYQDANEHVSQAFQINDNSYIIDGKNYYEFSIKDGERVQVIDQETAYIPTITKAREYNGGGVSFDAFNLLQPGFIEQFIGVANQKVYQLSQSDLDETEVKAWVLDANGNWNPKEEDTDFSVDRITGKVTFVTAPGVTPLEGEDSIRIQAYKTFEGYRDRVTKCRFGTLYGVSGAADRIFLSGNPEHPNWDFYSQFKDGTYFPDIGYTDLGSSQSAITGYAIVSNYLATFKDGFDQSQSVFVREGDMLVTDEEQGTSEPVFKLINSLQGVGSISPYSFGYLQTEPVFLTKAGIYAITEQDITGEKYSQNRSFYLDGKLRKEPNLSTAFATVHDNQYILALNGQLYVLDGLQATRTDKSEPYATRQYAGFYCTDIPANILWEDDAVCFGTNDGKVCRFYTDVDALTSYNDDGKPIYSCWETPDLDGKLFYKNKTFRYMAVRLMQAIKTSVKLYSRRFGLWTLNDETAWNFIKEQTSISNMLDFENFDFNLLSFSADLTERLVHTKLRVKKVDKARFRVENGELNEPFGLFDLALEYIESGNYKG